MIFSKTASLQDFYFKGQFVVTVQQEFIMKGDLLLESITHFGFYLVTA